MILSFTNLMHENKFSCLVNLMKFSTKYMKKAGQNKFFCPVIIRKPSKITPDDKSMTIKKGKKRKIS